MGLRTFTFGGKSSSAYSMFITEAATYNVPERAVEMLEIPGRNGAYALDQGRFENVEVTYHVVVHKDTNANFQTELSDVRNWLASKVGYQRLTDDYNSNVYRMAIFKGGLETDETFVNGAEFDIVFECKPQRWLTSGETATAVADEGTLTNPTLFDASPLLEVKGYGNIDIGGQSIDIVDGGVIGDVIIWNGGRYNTFARTITLDANVLNANDAFSVNINYVYIQYSPETTRWTFKTKTIDSATNCTASMPGRIVNIFPDEFIFVKGTTSTASFSVAYTIVMKTTYGTYQERTTSKSLTFSIAYDGNDTIQMSVSGTFNVSETTNDFEENISEIHGNSTKSALGNPMYIDCDIGECWNEDSGVPVPVNNSVTLPSDLPVIPADSTTTFNYDNTITEFKVTPRWWKV